MVQIAMAVKSVPYKDIVFVQYPTGTDPADQSRVLPVTSAADTLFAALKANKALNLTGKASPVGGVDVTAEATPGPSASPSTDDEAVDLPSSITGSTAAQVTCTQPQH